MPGPTGNQPSSLKSPVPVSSGTPPEAQSIEFKDPLDVNADRAPSSDINADDIADDLGVDPISMPTFDPSVPYDASGVLSNIQKAIDIEDLSDDIPIVAEGGSGASEMLPNGELNPFFGKKIESNILGKKLKVEADGSVEIFDKKKKSYRPLSEGELQFFGRVYENRKNMLGNVMSSLPGLVPGYGKMAMGLKIAGSGSASVAGDVVSNLLRYNNESDYVLRRALQVSDDDEFETMKNANTYWRAGMSMGAESIGQGLGAAAGRVSKKSKNLEALLPSVEQAAETQETAARLGIHLTPAEAASGLPGLQFAGEIGVPEIKSLSTPAQLAIMRGSSSPGDAIAFEVWNQSRTNKAIEAFDKLSTEITGSHSGKGPLDLEISQIGKQTPEGIVYSPENQNVFDRIKEKQLKEVGQYRQELRNIGLQRQFIDPVPILAEAEASIKPLLPTGNVDIGNGRVGSYINQDGTVNWPLVLTNKQIASGPNQAYRAVINQVSNMRKMVERIPGGLDRLKKLSREPVFSGEQQFSQNQYQGLGGPDSLPNMKGAQSLDRPVGLQATRNTNLFAPAGEEFAGSTNQVQMSLPGKEMKVTPRELLYVNENLPGVRETSLTFDQITALTDSLQDLAYSKNMEGTFAGVLKRMADVSRKLEGEAAKQIADRNGRPMLAKAYEDANQRASKAINAASSIGAMVNANPEAIGPIIFSSPSRLKMAMSVMNDSQINQLKANVIESAKFGNIQKLNGSTMMKMDPSAIKSELFGSASKMASSKVLFGASEANQLKSLLEVMERIPGNEAPIGAQMGGIQKGLAVMKAMKGSYAYGEKLFADLLTSRPELKDIVMGQVRQISTQLESKAAKLAQKAAFNEKYVKPAVSRAGSVINMSTAIPGIYDSRTKKEE